MTLPRVNQKRWLWASLLLCTLLVFTAGALRSGEAEHDELIEVATTRGYITTHELASLIDRGGAPPILDVRFRREYASGHIPGAVHIPFSKIRKRLIEVPSAPGQPLIVYCAHGPRAWMARSTLRRNGIENTLLLKGHWRRWTKEGHPVEK
jgi:rhodanese-related sulfurtransferase